jgi:hypothetical protein
MNQHFDLTGYLDGFQVTYRGKVIWQGNTWTGACRAMIKARQALSELLMAGAV